MCGETLCTVWCKLVCARRKCSERVVDWTSHYQDHKWLSYNRRLTVPNVINITMLSTVYLIMFSPIVILLHLSVWHYVKYICWADKLYIRFLAIYSWKLLLLSKDFASLTMHWTILSLTSHASSVPLDNTVNWVTGLPPTWNSKTL
jgi:hypothetical protein